VWCYADPSSRTDALCLRAGYRAHRPPTLGSLHSRFLLTDYPMVTNRRESSIGRSHSRSESHSRRRTRSSSRSRSGSYSRSDRRSTRSGSRSTARSQSTRSLSRSTDTRSSPLSPWHPKLANALELLTERSPPAESTAGMEGGAVRISPAIRNGMEHHRRRKTCREALRSERGKNMNKS
jgi:hypothetical protein